MASELEGKSGQARDRAKAWPLPLYWARWLAPRRATRNGVPSSSPIALLSYCILSGIIYCVRQNVLISYSNIYTTHLHTPHPTPRDFSSAAACAASKPSLNDEQGRKAAACTEGTCTRNPKVRWYPHMHPSTEPHMQRHAQVQMTKPRVGRLLPPPTSTLLPSLLKPSIALASPDSKAKTEKRCGALRRVAEPLVKTGQASENPKLGLCSEACTAWQAAWVGLSERASKHSVP